MSLVKSKAVVGNTPLPIPMGSEVVNVMLAVAVASTEVALNDIYHMCDLPEDCVLVDAVYDPDDLDSGSAVSMNFGELNAAKTDLATVLQTGITGARTGVAARMTPTSATLGFQSGGNAGRPLGFKVATAATGGVAGEMRLSLSYRSVHHGS